MYVLESENLEANRTSRTHITCPKVMHTYTYIYATGVCRYIYMFKYNRQPAYTRQTEYSSFLITKTGEHNIVR